MDSEIATASAPEMCSAEVLMTAVSATVIVCSISGALSVVRNISVDSVTVIGSFAGATWSSVGWISPESDTAYRLFHAGVQDSHLDALPSATPIPSATEMWSSVGAMAALSETDIPSCLLTVTSHGYSTSMPSSRRWSPRQGARHSSIRHRPSQKPRWPPQPLGSGRIG